MLGMNPGLGCSVLSFRQRVFWVILLVCSVLAAGMVIAIKSSIESGFEYYLQDR